MASGCGGKKKPTPAKKKVEKPKKKAPPPPKPLNVERALGLVPADVQFVAGLLDLPAVYKLFGSVEGAFSQLPAGLALITQAKQNLTKSPIPIPMKVDGLVKLGINPTGPALIMQHRQQPYFVLPLKDAKAFRAGLAPVGSWSESKEGDLPIATFQTKTGKQAHCHIDGARAFCGKSKADLVTLLKEKRESSLFTSLNAAQKASLAGATLLLRVNETKGQVFAVAKVEKDGVSTRAQVTGRGLEEAGKMLAQVAAAKSADSKLLGLGKDSGALLYLHLPAAAIVQQITQQAQLKGGLAALTEVIGEVKNLTGEVLAVSRPPSGHAVIFGTTTLELAQQTVERLAKVIREGIKKSRRKPDAPKVKLTEKKLNGRKALVMKITGKTAAMPLDLEIGVAAGPLGLVIGAWAVVVELTAVDKSDAKAFIASLESPEAKQAFGDGTVLAMRMPLGDPLGQLAEKIQTLQAQLPPLVQAQAKTFIDLGRFMFEHLYDVMMGYQFKAPATVEIVARLTTLYRDGNPNDLKARPVWLQAMKAKYGGDAATYETTLEKLAAEHKDTRYAQLKERKSTFFTTAIGVAAAVAIPAFLKYTRRTKTVEAVTNLARIRAGANAFYQQHKAFPAGKTGWTPAKPCCKDGQRHCITTLADWTKKPWKALNFALAGKHFYQYRYQGRGKGPRATFTAEARGDLDCNGKFSSFKLQGKVKDGAVELKKIEIKAELE